MAKREPGVGQVGAKNTKTFFPSLAPGPGSARTNATMVHATDQREKRKKN